MSARLSGVAGGSQSAVVKLASFGGGGRLPAMINYISRSGELVVENERGEELRGRQQLAAIGGEWDSLMSHRAESRDIGVFRIEVTQELRPDDDVDERARQIVRRAFGERRFAFAVRLRTDGSGFDIAGVVVLRSAQGERLSADEKAAAIVQKRLDGPGDRNAGEITVRFTGYGNGTDYGSARLRALVDRYAGNVQDDRARLVGDGKRAGDLVQRKWRDELHSRKSRDVMHLVLSARAGTNVEAFRNAARDFLALEFDQHRYVFSVHDASSDPRSEIKGGKRPHVHVHAIVAMRSDDGERIRTTISDFRRWRLGMAEKARLYGIRMEMTDRRERASAPSFTRTQVRPTMSIGRTEHEGTSAAGQSRYDAKRQDRASLANTPRSRNYTDHARIVWREVAEEATDSRHKTYAENQMFRIETAQKTFERTGVHTDANQDAASQYRTDMVKFLEMVSEGEDMRQMTRSEYEAYEKRVETALSNAEGMTPPSERVDFEEIASAVREHLKLRRELVGLNEELAQIERREQSGAGRKDTREDDGRRRNAVRRYDLATAEPANRVLVEIERSREAIERAEAENRSAGEIRTLKQDLDRDLTKAAELGASGNRLIRDVAEIDNELRAALRALERERTRAERDQGEHGHASRGNAGDLDQRDGSNQAKSANEHDPRLEAQKHETEERDRRDRDDGRER
jgi:ribosomal protein S20